MGDIIREVCVSFHWVTQRGQKWVDWSGELDGGPRAIWELLMIGESIEKPGSRQYFNSPAGVLCRQRKLMTPMVFGRTGGEVDQDNPGWPWNSLGVVHETKAI